MDIEYQFIKLKLFEETYQEIIKIFINYILIINFIKYLTPPIILLSKLQYLAIY